MSPAWRAGNPGRLESHLPQPTHRGDQIPGSSVSSDSRRSCLLDCSAALIEHLACQAQCLALGTAMNKPDPGPTLTELS